MCLIKQILKKLSETKKAFYSELKRKDLEGGHELGDFFKKDTNTTIDKYIKFVDALVLQWSHPSVEELKIVSQKMSTFRK